METYDEQLEALCRDMAMYHLMSNGMTAQEAFNEYRDNPSHRLQIEGIASIHVGKMVHKDVAADATVGQIRGAVPLGNGRYRIYSPHRSAITGRFNKP